MDEAFTVRKITFPSVDAWYGPTLRPELKGLADSLGTALKEQGVVVLQLGKNNKTVYPLAEVGYERQSRKGSSQTHIAAITDSSSSDCFPSLFFPLA